MTSGGIKREADHENEIHNVHRHADPGRCVITQVFQLPPATAQQVIDSMTELVQTGHDRERADPTPNGQIKFAQTFEEGEVFMLEPPFVGYFADRYIMDFYDVSARDICSRMHLHTGLRFVRMMTGTDTTIRVSSLIPFAVRKSPAWPAGFDLHGFEDILPVEPGDNPDAPPVIRYNRIVPPCSWVDMQIPRGVSHQFNAVGPNAIIDSVHPEESIETLREGMSGYRMMAQTIFLAEKLPPAATCTSTGAA